MKMVALIPARAGSKRIPGKNTKLLAGHPLIAYTIAVADISNLFEEILVCTDDQGAMDEGKRWGCTIVSREDATDDQSDIVWVQQALRVADTFDAFAILRPTSPFRTAETIRRAYGQFTRSEVHSIRAVQPVKEHPGKMWQQALAGYPIVPLIGKTWPVSMPGYIGLDTADDRPWHSMPTQTLPQVYVQNASLEMAWSYVIPAFGTISGRKVAPFFTEGYEGFDVNYPEDWREAERLIAEGLVELPSVPLARI